MKTIYFTLLFTGLAHVAFTQVDTSIIDKTGKPMQMGDMDEGSLFASDVFPYIKSCDGKTSKEREECTRKAVFDFMKNHAKLPAVKGSEALEGEVVVGFKIGKKGKISDIVIVKSLDENYDNAVIKLIDEMKWKSLIFKGGTRKGKSVDVKVVYPVYFDSKPRERIAPELSMVIIRNGEHTKPITSFSKGIARVYKKVDKMPIFPAVDCGNIEYRSENPENPVNKCANKVLQFYINKHLIYPEEALKNGLEGTVVIQFIVEKDGRLTKIEVAESLNKACDKAALEVFTKMKDSLHWVPGKRINRTVRVQVKVPIQFSLDREKLRKN